MIVLFGATGNTGGEAARQLLNKNHRVRVVGRDRSKLAPLVARGAEACEADLERPTELKQALDGATVAYFLIPPNLATADFRAYQWRIATNLTDALAASHCTKVVLLSSLGANERSGTGPVVGLYEFERQLRRLKGVDTLTLRCGYFMENFLSMIPLVDAKGIFGAPTPAETPFSLIATADIGRYAASRLSKCDFNGFEIINLVGPNRYTMAEVTRTIGAAIGRPDLPYVEFSASDARAGMVSMGVKPTLADLFIELYQANAAGLLKPEAGTKVKRTSTSLANFASAFAETYRRSHAA
jgi:uncharacterized protein YbjT (DUF2867 family)